MRLRVNVQHLEPGDVFHYEKFPETPATFIRYLSWEEVKAAGHGRPWNEWPTEYMIAERAVVYLTSRSSYPVWERPTTFCIVTGGPRCP